MIDSSAFSIEATGTPFEVLADGLDHPEGIAVGPDGRLYAGGEHGQIYVIEADGAVRELGTTGGSLLGIALDAAGRVYACDAVRREVVRFDPRDESLTVYSGGVPERPLTLPNALAFAPDGALYITDSGNQGEDDGSVARIGPDGQTTLFSLEVPCYPNGCCVAADGTALYVVESYLPGISSIAIDPDGRPGAVSRLAITPAVPDGCALDSVGNLYVSCYRPDRIYRITPGGEVSVFADDPRGITLNAPTNLAFFGEGLRSLAAANVGEDFVSVAHDVTPGLRLFYPDLP